MIATARYAETLFDNAEIHLSSALSQNLMQGPRSFLSARIVGLMSMSKSLPNTEIVTPIIRALWESVPESKNLVLRIKAMRARLNPVANSVQWRWMLADDGKIPVGDACASFEEARDIAERLIMKRLEK